MFSSCLLLAALLTNCADVANREFAQRAGDCFDLTGQVIVNDNDGDPVLNLTDATGIVKVMGVRHVMPSLPFKSGDTIRTTGIIAIAQDSQTGRPSTICKSVQRIAIGEPPKRIRVSARDIISGECNGKPVVLRGSIRQIFRDEVDAKWLYIALSTPDGMVYLTAKGDTSTESEIRKFVDAEIDATGHCSSSSGTLRRMLGSTVGISWPKDISVLKPAPDDPYSVPLLDVNMVTDVSAINRLGRRRIVGTVLALCSGRRIILKTDGGDIHDVHLLDGSVPSCGTRIEAVGLPEADYYQINLVDSTWRKASGAPIHAGPPVDATLEGMLTDGKGHDQINPNFHGNVIRTTGILIDIPTREGGRDFAILKDKGGTILLDIASARQMLDSVSVGCRIRAAGVCTVNRESSMTPQRFQRVNGITLVVRSPDDVEVLEHPPWWTPARLMAVVGVLLLAIVGFFIWNRLLQRVIDRKSRQLMREQLSHLKDSLRIDERTHLAVELHDSLSQNLSGVACQIAATKGTLPAGADETARYLSTAERMLLSCRTELRRCLWDLRENALEEKDFAKAIRKTLDPVSIGSEVIVEVDVPRSHIDDSTAHSILCIIRELVTNAIHHGKASSVNVTGAINGHTLRFSVVDNGLGFDTTAAPNANEGHFGLEGIRERIKRMNGSFELKSSPENGCIAVITISCRSSKQ